MKKQLFLLISLAMFNLQAGSAKTTQEYSPDGIHVMFDSNYNQITTASDYYNKNMNCGSKNVGVLPSQSKIYYKFTNIYNCQSNCKIITCKIKPNYTR